MRLIKGYWKSKGKVPNGKEETRALLSEPPETGDYGAVYQEGIIRIDIDDYSHKTGQLENVVKGEPASEAVIQYLNDCGYEYVGIQTENGKHIVMQKPDWIEIESNKNNWFCAMGIRLEAHVTKPFEPLRVNGIDRNVFHGSLEESEIDILAPALVPIQKNAENPFSMNFETGDRNNHLSEYAFHLSNKGFQAEHIKEVIESMNRYVLEEPLDQSEIDVILRPETMEKLKTIEDQKKNGVVSPATFRKFLNTLGIKIKYNELLNVVEYGNIPKTPEYQDIVDVQNIMPIQLQYDFQKFTGKKVTRSQTTDLIALEADTHSYNPVKNYLQSVEWDGKDRFPEIFEILGVTDELQKSFIRKWFYQTAGIPFNDMKKPFQAEGVLILQGAEGIGKTRFFQQIAVDPTWFSSLDKEFTTKNKDILIQMLSVWIAEIGEVDRTFKANKSDVKSFITSRDDTIRKPYRMEQVKKARTTSFCGTTNKSAFLNTDTGSRRWWIIPVTKRIDMTKFVEKDNLHQFWAQCYAEYAKDENCFRLSKEEMDALTELNKESMELLPAEEELRNRFDFDADESEWNWTTASGLKGVAEYDVSNYTVQQIGMALSAISQDDSRIRYKRTKAGRKWFIPPAVAGTDRFRNKEL
jgi:hypothetical protein